MNSKLAFNDLEPFVEKLSEYSDRMPWHIRRLTILHSASFLRTNLLNLDERRRDRIIMKLYLAKADEITYAL